MSDSGTAIPAAPVVTAREPWLGLNSYLETDSELYFGREHETLELFRMLQREVLTVLFGPSGTGKTSLLNAGLFPKLRDSGFLPVYVRLDHTGVHASHARQVRKALADAVKASGAEAEALAESRVPPEQETLWEQLHRFVFWDRRNNPVVPVLVFDQFEEVFTLGRNRPATDTFLQELAGIVENYVPQQVRERLEMTGEKWGYPHHEQHFRVLLSLREDFVSGLDSLRKAMPSVMHNRYALTRMNGDQAMVAVVKPGRDVVDEPVAREIVCFVAAAKEATDIESEDFENLRVEPALLSVVCRELNTRRRREGKDRITRDLLQQSHRDILNDFYERSFEGLDPRARVFVEDHLLTGSGFRSTAPLEDATAFGLSEPVIQELVARRLIRIEERLNIPHVELTHDVLNKVVQKSRDDRHERDRREQREKQLAAQEERRKEELRKSRRWLLVIGSAAVVSVLFAIVALFAFNRARVAQHDLEVQRDATVTELVAAAWKASLFSWQYEYEQGYSYIPGLRAIYDHIKVILDLDKVQRLAGMPAFVSGPHSSALNLESYDFGRYNPAFVRWAKDHLVPTENDESLRPVVQSVYDVYLRDMARLYYLAYRRILTDPARLERVSAGYLSEIEKYRGETWRRDSFKGPGIYLQEQFRPDADALQKDVPQNDLSWHYGVVAHGFWVRRHIDGSLEELAGALEKLLLSYDAEWFQPLKDKP